MDLKLSTTWILCIYEGDDYKQATKYFDEVSGRSTKKNCRIIKPI
jgi:hypothetical protein